MNNREGRVLAWGDPLSGSDGEGEFALPVGTVAFLLTDVEGSTRAWEAEPDAMAAAMERHNAILDAAVSANGGVSPPAQGEGDSIVAVFARPSDAVLAALDAQRGLVAEEWPTARPLRVRMAVHAGEARFLDDGNYAGQAIIRTARLRAIAHGGQVLVSAPARDLTVDHLGDTVAFADLGEHRLRDLARPERVYQLCGDGLLEGFEPVRSLDSHPHNFPLQLSSFIGRAQEVATVVDLVSAHRLVTIIGAGGAGKTRLAQQAAAEVLDRFADGVWWIELAELSYPTVVPGRIATPLGVKADLGAGAAEALAGRLTEHRALLVLDNCEHLVGPIAEIVDRILRACPHMSILATSREALEVSGEIAWRIPPLRVPAAFDRVPIGALDQYESVSLFLDRARAVRANFHLDDTNGAAIAAICARVDGIPLALELAAARCRSLTPDRILSGLNDALALLTGGGRTALPRQQTLEASIAWSHDLLTPPEQAALRRLSAFAGSCTLEDAEAVLADDLLDGAVILDILDRLVAQSLVQLDDTHGVPRYRVLETVRQYAARLLEASGERRAVATRHAEHFLGLAEAVGVDVEGPNDLDAYARAVADAENFAVALDTFAAESEWESHGRLVVGLAWARAITDPLRNVRDLTVALDSTRQGSALTIALLSARAMTHGINFNGSGATLDAVACLPLAYAARDDRSARRANCVLGQAMCWGDPRAGDELLASCIADARAAGDPFVDVLASSARGSFALLQSGAVDVFEAAFADAVPSVAQLGEIAAATYHARAAAQLALQGHLVAASERAALADAGVVDLARATGLSFEHLAKYSFVGVYAQFAHMWCAMAGGEPVDVAEVKRVVARGRADGLTHISLLMAWCLGHLRYFDGDVDGALGEFQAVSELAGAIGTPGYVVAANVLRAGIHHERGEVHLARATLTATEEMSERSGFFYDQARFHHRCGVVALAEGEVAEAERRAHLALDRGVSGDFWWEIAIVVELLAGIAAVTAAPGEGARLAGFAAAFREDRPLPPFFFGDGERLEAVIAACRDALGDEAFETAWAEGRSMTLDRVMEYVRRTRGERKRPTSGWESLTPTEWQVIERVQAGRTNPQIADELLMARDTVKSHLAHIFTKLGMRTRSELAAASLAHRPV